jgi:hypothetical protein
MNNKTLQVTVISTLALLLAHMSGRAAEIMSTAPAGFNILPLSFAVALAVISSAVAVAVAVKIGR